MKLVIKVLVILSDLYHLQVSSQIHQYQLNFCFSQYQNIQLVKSLLFIKEFILNDQISDCYQILYIYGSFLAKSLDLFSINLNF
jgi:hypothetical protein